MILQARQVSTAASGLVPFVFPSTALLPPLPAWPCKRRELEAMAAAHWPAVQALAAACNLDSLASPPAWSKLAVGLAVCMGKGPLALAADQDLQRLFGDMLGRVPRVSLC